MPYPTVALSDLKRAREAYAYPATGLGGSIEDFEILMFGSTTELDDHHYALLKEAEPERAVLGYLSALFWGRVSGADGRVNEPYALAKVEHARNGRRTKVNGVEARSTSLHRHGTAWAAGKISAAHARIQAADYGGALRLLMELPQLQAAFASKVCAFMAPDKCGVIDSVIVGRYPQFGFELRGRFVSPIASNFAQYSHYCQYLQSTARTLNESGQHATWRDRDGVSRPWRAVDVERALYGAAEMARMGLRADK